MLSYLSLLVCLGQSCHVTIPVERGFFGIAACEQEGMLITPSWEEANHPWHVTRIRCTIGQPPKAEDRT